MYQLLLWDLPSLGFIAGVVVVAAVDFVVVVDFVVIVVAIDLG